MRLTTRGKIVGWTIIVLTGATLGWTTRNYVAPDWPRVTEEDPTWDCRTMGNHTCGVGEYVVEFDDRGMPVAVRSR